MPAWAQKLVLATDGEKRELADVMVKALVLGHYSAGGEKKEQGVLELASLHFKALLLSLSFFMWMLWEF